MVNFNAAGVDVSPKELQVCVPSDRDEKCKRTFGVYKVKIEGLGTFYTTLECKKGGALTKEKFNINSNLDGLHIRFLPEQEQEQNISSRQFLKQAEFINVDSLLKKEDEDPSAGGGSQTGGETGGGSQTGGGGNDDNNNDAPPVINPDTDHPSDGD